MANNRLIAVCLHPECPARTADSPNPERKTIMKFYPSTGWYYLPEGTDEFFEDHKHGGLWGNYIVFLPEIRGVDALNRADDGEVAQKVIELLHGNLHGHCDLPGDFGRKLSDTKPPSQ